MRICEACTLVAAAIVVTAFSPGWVDRASCQTAENDVAFLCEKRMERLENEHQARVEQLERYQRDHSTEGLMRDSQVMAEAHRLASERVLQMQREEHERRSRENPGQGFVWAPPAPEDAPAFDYWYDYYRREIAEVQAEPYLETAQLRRADLEREYVMAKEKLARDCERGEDLLEDQRANERRLLEERAEQEAREEWEESESKRLRDEIEMERDRTELEQSIAKAVSEASRSFDQFMAEIYADESDGAGALIPPGRLDPVRIVPTPVPPMPRVEPDAAPDSVRAILDLRRKHVERSKEGSQ